MMETERDLEGLLATFLEIGVRVAQELDIDRTLTSIVERSMETTGARYGAAVTVTNGSIESFLHRGLTPEEVAALPHLPEGKGLLGVVLERREPIRLENISEHPASVGFPDRHVPMNAFLGVPMMARERLVGALYLSKSPGMDPFTDIDEAFTSAVAAMAAVGIENARLLTGERDRAERSALLGDISSQIRRSLNLDNTMNATVELLGRAAGVDRCYIRLPRAPGSSELGAIAYEWDAPGVAPLAHHRQFPVASLAIKTGKTQWSIDIADDDRLSDPAISGAPADLLAYDARAVLSTPLTWGDEVLGVITFHSALPRQWSGSDIALIEAVAREVSVAYRHARLYGQAIETADELKKVDRVRQDFVAMVSHELRSPMTVISGIAELLEKRGDRIDDDRKAELVETLGRESRRLARLVSEVLDLQSLEMGGFSMQFTSLDLSDVARESIADAGLKDRVELLVEPGDTVVSGDADRIKQVILNLLSNAAKFSPEHEPIRVTVAPEKQAIVVTVSDRGPGIAPEDQDRLFQRFSRLTSAAEEVGGSGLGLYLSKAIVEAHGGAIWADSEVGRGSDFSFRLPR